MELEKLLKGINYKNNIENFKHLNIEKLSISAQSDLKKGMFFCFKGNTNGYDYVKTAIENGAVCIVCDHKIDESVCQVVVEDVRAVIGLISQNFYSTSNVKVIGITGTNGKTTTSFIIKNILECANKKVGLIGTNGIYFADKFLPAKLTTPDPIDLHEIFSIMKQGGVDYIVMEVSAHAIALRKIEGINFVCKILTNITQDHLDFFKTMQSYKEAKLSFFNKEDLMIINSDDQGGQQLLNKYENAITYGLNNPSDAFCVEINKNCTNYMMNICDNVLDIKSNLYGLFNVYNTLAASCCCYFLGIKPDNIKKGIESLKSIDGRFNVIEFENKKIIIDYAHTPDGLENVLKTARKITNGKLFCLFGCGGNRDRKKRNIMGAIAEKYSDFCYVTSDNPRFEQPEKIIEDILLGFNAKKYYSISDRKTAIGLAINALKEEDSLLICGKGGENYMDIKGEKIPYSDYKTVCEFIEERRC